MVSPNEGQHWQQSLSLGFYHIPKVCSIASLKGLSLDPILTTLNTPSLEPRVTIPSFTFNKIILNHPYFSLDS